VVGASAALSVIVLAAGASPASAASKPAAPAKPILRWAGAGNEASGHVLLPAKWTVIWHFSCKGATHGKPFAMVARSQKPRHLIQIIAQNGLGGGGQKSYAAAGMYVFSVTTACDWDLSVVRNVPPTNAS
jgi:hypothetical protein